MIMFTIIFILILCIGGYFIEETKTGKKIFDRICKFLHMDDDCEWED